MPESTTCPNCRAFSLFKWSWLYTEEDNGFYANKPFFVGTCHACKDIAIFSHDQLVHPTTRLGPAPNPDMPDVVKKDFEEARTIASMSPRGAAALLRLSIQRLMIELGEPGKKLDDDIAALVGKGLDDRIQKALDVVRVIGNNAVHPGQIDIDDRPEDVESLFTLVNLIVDDLISKPKRLDRLYGGLPKRALEAIDRRNERARRNSST